MITEKKCPRCNEVKLISEYGHDRSTKSGIACYCLDCGKSRTREYWLERHSKLTPTPYKPYCRSNRMLGAKRIDDGYISINMGGGVWRQEHRLVIEQYLGHPLTSHEQVHHINGDKLDNRLDNLFVLDVKSHSRNHFILYREVTKLTWQVKWLTETNKLLAKQIRALQWQNKEYNLKKEIK